MIMGMVRAASGGIPSLDDMYMSSVGFINCRVLVNTEANMNSLRVMLRASIGPYTIVSTMSGGRTSHRYSMVSLLVLSRG